MKTLFFYFFKFVNSRTLLRLESKDIFNKKTYIIIQYILLHSSITILKSKIKNFLNGNKFPI